MTDATTLRPLVNGAEDANGEAVALLLDGGGLLLKLEAGDTKEDLLCRAARVALRHAILAPTPELRVAAIRRADRFLGARDLVDAQNDAAWASLRRLLDAALAWLRRAAGCLERLRAACCGRRREVA